MRMTTRVLVTGGAGFIGSHLVDALVARGYAPRVLDNLDQQVHGADAAVPAAIADHVRAGRVEFQQGDVRDPVAVARALEGVEIVLHQAAAVGVGQSMYRVAEYVSANSLGAAVLLDAIIARKRPITKMIVASSMSIYGEGRYACAVHGDVSPPLRESAQFEAGDWELHCEHCGAVVEPRPTDEDKPIQPTSVYAVTKRDHEELFLALGRAYGIPAVALRYFNVYGPRQSLSNPYTGVGAIFTSRLVNRKAPLVFEDGLQSRDFIHVSDIVRANMLALEQSDGDGQVLNVGTGRRLSLLEMVHALRAKLGGPAPVLLGRFRHGDVRHCFADVSRIRKVLGFEPQVRFEDGLDDLVTWSRGQEAVDRVEQARAELEAARLTV
jgi:dTDP-L-rhamnose 4-epimerase